MKPHSAVVALYRVPVCQTVLVCQMVVHAFDIVHVLDSKCARVHVCCAHKSCFVIFSLRMLTILVSNLFSQTVQFSLGRIVWKRHLSLCWRARIAASVLRQLSRTIHLPLYFSTVRAHADCPSYVAPPRLASVNLMCVRCVFVVF